MGSAEYEDDASFRAQLPTSYMRTLFSVWCDWRGTDRMPMDAQLDPAQIGPALAFLSLVVVEHDPVRFFVRVVGDGVREGTGTNYTGRYLGDTKGMEVGVARLEEYIRNPVPAIDFRIPMEWSPKSYKTCSSLLLPFQGSDGRVARMLICLSFDD